MLPDDKVSFKKMKEKRCTIGFGLFLFVSYFLSSLCSQLRGAIKSKITQQIPSVHEAERLLTPAYEQWPRLP